MNSLVAQQQGYSFPMDEIPRTYYPGRGFLTDQEAYPERPFYRTPRYSGGLNIPGAPGNLQTLPYITSSPSFEIPGGQSPYRFGPYLPYRGEEKREEETPFIPLPVQRAQVLPIGFQNKYVS